MPPENRFSPLTLYDYPNLKIMNAIKNQLDKDLKDVLDVNKDVATINVSIAM